MKAIKVKDLALDLLFAVIGAALVGAGVSIFTVPNDIAPGGVSGAATALAYITPIHVSAWNLIMNVPLLLGAWKLLGRHSLVFTLISTALLSLFIELFERFVPGYSNNVLLASVFGGVLTGLGVGILFLRGLSTGGTDLAALMLHKAFPNVPNGVLLLICDAAVVLFAVCVFRDIEVALYSTITIYVSSKVIDALAQGVDYAKVIYIVTSEGEKVNAALCQYTDRGTTLLPAVGGYTMNNKQVIITVTRRNVLSQTLRVIKQADPRAFTFVTDSTEVHGEGFKLDD